MRPDAMALPLPAPLPGAAHVPGADRADMIAALAGVALAGVTLAPAMAAAWLLGARDRARLAGDVEAALACIGIDERPGTVTTLGGGRSNGVYRLAVAGRTVILKRALPVGTILALAARWVGPQPFASDVGAAARIGREARALDVLAAAGVRVPAVLAADPEAGWLLLEDLPGAVLARRLRGGHRDRRLAGYGAALSAAHAAGVVITDGHPGNALVGRDERVALIDLEFAELAAEVDDPDRRRAFDVAYAAAFLTPDEREVFLAAAGPRPGLTEAVAELARFEPLFARERVRQRGRR